MTKPSFHLKGFCESRSLRFEYLCNVVKCCLTFQLEHNYYYVFQVFTARAVDGVFRPANGTPGILVLRGTSSRIV